jgi:transcriptional regulator with XRE-family HTH domain
LVSGLPACARPPATQVAFAAEVGVTQRMVAYYEAPNAQPPAHLLPQMAQVLDAFIERVNAQGA